MRTRRTAGAVPPNFPREIRRMKPDASTVSLPRAPGPLDVLLSGVGGFALSGLFIGCLTLRINPHFRGDLGASCLTLLYFVAGYGALGIAIGLAGALLSWSTYRSSLPPRFRSLVTNTLVSGLLLGPPSYSLLLPDAGLAERALGKFLFEYSTQGRFLSLATVGTLVIALGVLAGNLVGRVEKSTQLSPRQSIAGLLLVIAAGVFLWEVVARPEDGPWRSGSASIARSADQVHITPAFTPAPLVLLCIDGADLDDVVLPMARSGQLPTFSRLMQEGTWGPLDTILPTVSPAVWTTIITGKPPTRHGISHFVSFRLPGIPHAIRRFPQHTGLNFQVFPLLDTLPGFPSLQAPYTSNLRQTEALWNIVGRFHRVGVYRWLVNWPAEPVNGFNVAGGVVEFVGRGLQEVGDWRGQGFFYPDNLNREMAEWTKEPAITPEAIQAYVGAGHTVDPESPRIATIRSSLSDTTSEVLPRLMSKFSTKFTAAAFYSVDDCQHQFSTQRDSGGAFSPAIAECYRHTDRRLGEFLGAIEHPTNVIVISDHGYDFTLHHHILAPAGIFLAEGPAFDPGRRIGGLSVYDIAPLSLHLLGLPLAEDMTGTSTATYRRALAQDFLATHPVAQVPTYERETVDHTDHRVLESPIDNETKKALRSLGYIR